jgi:hypothetical protein
MADFTVLNESQDWTKKDKEKSKMWATVMILLKCVRYAPDEIKF